jgi:hypothetical protein
MPIQAPMAIAITVEVPISNRVAKTCRPITASTDMPSRKERPQSPCTRRQAQSKYWIHSGLFSPNCSASRSRSCWVMPGSRAYCDRGPPGIRFRMVKPMIETITSSTRLCERRFSRNPRIRPSSNEKFSSALPPQMALPDGAAAANISSPKTRRRHSRIRCAYCR